MKENQMCISIYDKTIEVSFSVDFCEIYAFLKWYTDKYLLLDIYVYVAGLMLIWI